VVVADQKSSLAFRLAGIETRVVRHEDDVVPVVKDSLRRQDVGILLITDEIADQAASLLEEQPRHHLLPLVVRIPSYSVPKTKRLGAKERLAALLKR